MKTGLGLKRYGFGLLSVALILMTTLGIHAQQRPFEGVSLVVAGDAGHNLRPFEWWADEIYEQSGIRIREIVGLPFTGVYEKLKTEFIAGSGAFDIVVFYPAFIGDFAGNGYLLQLDEYAQKHDPELDDVIPAFRELYLKWQGKLYALPFDGDVLNLYYRTDLFNDPQEKEAFRARYGYELAPPATWDEWLDVAEFFTRDTDGDGRIDLWGAAEYGQRGNSWAWWANRFAAYGGVYFDEDMNPMINSEAGVKALENMIATLQFSPPDTLAYGYEELRDVFLQGRVAMVVQWADVGKKGNDPELSHIPGKLGVAPMPGVRLPDGTIRRRAMMPVGRVLAVTKDTRHPEAAYWVIRFLTSKEKSLHDVSSSQTGLDPYRYSHFANPEAYDMFASIEEATNYLQGVQANMEIGYPELTIPGAWQFEDALDLQINRALAGQLSPQQALDAAAQEWRNIVQRFGRDMMRRFYLDSLQSWRTLGLWEE